MACVGWNPGERGGMRGQEDQRNNRVTLAADRIKRSGQMMEGGRAKLFMYYYPVIFIVSVHLQAKVMVEVLI